MKFFVCTLLVSCSLPLGGGWADERPQYYGEYTAEHSSAVFSTPSHRRHVVGIPPDRGAPDAVSHPDVVAVESTTLDLLSHDDSLDAVPAPTTRTAFEKYCDQGKGMSDDDWRAVERAGGMIPDALLPDCLPPK
jgi:hypothetical protein|tara:strand:- start:328 stop:729 length:402 start_codon:yes stop_codon:yes gene_type:complete